MYRVQCMVGGVGCRACGARWAMGEALAQGILCNEIRAIQELSQR